MELNRPLATVTPTLDGDVLAVLAMRDTTFTTGQIHRVLNAFSEEGIRKVLARLVRQGVVTAERVGNAYAYRFNTDHLAAEPILALAHLTKTLLARLEIYLGGWEPPPTYAAVFGSAARGTMTVDSDIDILRLRRRIRPRRFGTSGSRARDSCDSVDRERRPGRRIHNFGAGGVARGAGAAGRTRARAHSRRIA